MQMIKNKENGSIEAIRNQMRSSDLLQSARIVSSIDVKRNREIFEEAKAIFKEKMELFSNNGDGAGYEERVIRYGLVDTNISPSSRAVPLLLLTVYLVIGFSIAGNYSGSAYLGIIIVTILVSAPQLWVLYEGSKTYLRASSIELIKRNKIVEIQYRSIIKFERIGSECLIWYVEDEQIRKKSFPLKKSGSFNSVSSSIKNTLWPK